MVERGHATSITAEVLRIADEIIWTLEDTTHFIAGPSPLTSAATGIRLHHPLIKR